MKRNDADTKRLADAILRWRVDPGMFVRQVFGAKPWAGQDAILNAIAPPGAHVAVRSGHRCGKSTALAWLVLWFTFCFKDSRVPCTAPGAGQLRDVLWPEIRKWHNRMHPFFKAHVRVTADHVRIVGMEQSQFAAARTARKEQPEALQGFTRLGMGVLLVEYPGYGRSEGSPSERSIAEALSAGYDSLVARPDVDPDRIVLVGRSLGGGAICTLAGRRPSAALILMSTFTSIRTMAWRHLLPGFLVRDPFDNLAVVRDYPGPILIIHGTADGVVPYSHGLSLSLAASNSRLITYRCGHNDCPPDWPAFWYEAETFLRESGVLGPE